MQSSFAEFLNLVELIEIFFFYNVMETEGLDRTFFQFAVVCTLTCSSSGLFFKSGQNIFLSELVAKREKKGIQLCQNHLLL